MKKLLIFILALTIFPNIYISAINIVYLPTNYNVTYYNNSAYDLETGIIEASNYMARTEAFEVLNGTELDIQYYHYVLFWDAQGAYIGYKTTPSASFNQLNTWIGNQVSNSVSYPSGVKTIAFMVERFGVDRLALGQLTYDDVFNSTVDYLDVGITELDNLSLNEIFVLGETIPPLVNLVTNGDFSDGTVVWASNVGSISSDNQSITITNNTASVITTTLDQNIGATINDVVYVVYTIQLLSGTASGFQLSRPYNGIVKDNLVINTPYTLSQVGSVNNTTFRTQAINLSVGGSYKVTRVTSVSLTQAFGAGNEPTDLQMDSVIKWNGGYFNTGFDYHTFILDNNLTYETFEGFYVLYISAAEYEKLNIIFDLELTELQFNDLEDEFYFYDGYLFTIPFALFSSVKPIYYTAYFDDGVSTAIMNIGLTFIFGLMAFGLMTIGLVTNKAIFNLFAIGAFLAFGVVVVSNMPLLVVSIGGVIFNVYYAFWGGRD